MSTEQDMNGLSHKGQGQDIDEVLTKIVDEAFDEVLNEALTDVFKDNLNEMFESIGRDIFPYLDDKQKELYQNAVSKAINQVKATVTRVSSENV